MNALYDHVDPDGLREFSVVYTDRALNHMSGNFQTVMRDISANLRTVYHASQTVLVPGSGSFAMEAVARQFANDQHCLILRNGWFSYRWSQILDAGSIAASTSVLKASRVAGSNTDAFAPFDIEQAVARIEQEKPAVVFAPHVETSAGMILPDDYITALADAVHAHGGLFVLDCIASGTIWVDMQATGVDVLISAPQKGWSGPPCCGIAMLGPRAVDALEQTESSSFACDLKKWSQIMQAYETGGHAYHATMPTESLRVFRDVMLETREFGFDLACQRQRELGRRVRALLAEFGFQSVAAAGFEAPGVIVSYTTDPAIRNGALFAEAGIQIAAGVPLMCDEGEDFSTFRIGLFGLDKLVDVDQTVAILRRGLERVAAHREAASQPAPAG
jgi:aspartate aminotransferase-like enzyme